MATMPRRRRFGALRAEVMGCPAALISDQFGSLFGTTSEGGTYGYGNVLRLQPTSDTNGTIAPIALWSFAGGTDGGYPTAITMDVHGSLYGTLAVGNGLDSAGSIYMLSASAGKWQLSNLFQFSGGVAGSNPSALSLAGEGRVVGTATGGGANACLAKRPQEPCGVAFALSKSPSGSSHWHESIISDFAPTPSANGLSGPLLQNARGGYYGVTSLGGAYKFRHGCFHASVN